jgi:hypothetical protein
VLDAFCAVVDVCRCVMDSVFVMSELPWKLLVGLYVAQIVYVPTGWPAGRMYPTVATPLALTGAVVAVPRTVVPLLTVNVTVPAVTVELPAGLPATVADRFTVNDCSEYWIEAFCAVVVVGRGLTVRIL